MFMTDVHLQPRRMIQLNHMNLENSVLRKDPTTMGSHRNHANERTFKEFCGICECCYC